MYSRNVLRKTNSHGIWRLRNFETLAIPAHMYNRTTRNIFTLGGKRLQTDGDILLIFMEGHAVERERKNLLNTIPSSFARPSCWQVRRECLSSLKNSDKFFHVHRTLCLRFCGRVFRPEGLPTFCAYLRNQHGHGTVMGRSWDGHACHFRGISSFVKNPIQKVCCIFKNILSNTYKISVFLSVILVLCSPAKYQYIRHIAMAKVGIYEVHVLVSWGRLIY